MSLDAGEQAAIIGVGATVLLAAVGAVFKASSLRGDLNNKWTRRVSLAIAGLDDKALSELDGFATTWKTPWLIGSIPRRRSPIPPR